MDRTDKTSGDKAKSALATPTDLSENGVKAIAASLNGLAADMFALYIKTKNFHWHMSGQHFRDYHLLLDEQSDPDFRHDRPLADVCARSGSTTLRSIGHIGKLQSIKDDDQPFVGPLAMLSELNSETTGRSPASMRKTHELCDDNGDVATASLLEVWIDETERRTGAVPVRSDPRRRRQRALSGARPGFPVATDRLDAPAGLRRGPGLHGGLRGSKNSLRTGWGCLRILTGLLAARQKGSENFSRAARSADRRPRGSGGPHRDEIRRADAGRSPLQGRPRDR